MKRKVIYLLILCLLSASFLCGCNRPAYEKTAETEAALEAYLAAVDAQTQKSEGHIKCTMSNDDPVIDKAKRETRIDYTYNVTDGKESFTMKSEQTGKEAVELVGKDDAVYKRQADGTLAIVSGQYGGYLKHSTNPISTLQMFRMDANKKFQHSLITSIKKTEKEDGTYIEVTFDADQLTDQVIKSNADVQRTMSEMKRTYVLSDGVFTRIEVLTRQKAVKGETKGEILTTVVVEIQ